MEEKEDKITISNQKRLHRIQIFKYLVIFSILVIMSFCADSIDISNDFQSLGILCVAAFLLFISLYAAIKDAFLSINSEEEAKEVIQDYPKYTIFLLVSIGIILIFLSKILNAYEMITANTAMMR